LLELGKAQIASNKAEEGLATLERVLENSTENSDNRDFEFIIEIERRIASVMRTLGRFPEADEIDRRLQSVTDVLEVEPEELGN